MHAFAKADEIYVVLCLEMPLAWPVVLNDGELRWKRNFTLHHKLHVFCSSPGVVLLRCSMTASLEVNN